MIKLPEGLFVWLKDVVQVAQEQGLASGSTYQYLLNEYGHGFSSDALRAYH